MSCRLGKLGSKLPSVLGVLRGVLPPAEKGVGKNNCSECDCTSGAIGASLVWTRELSRSPFAGFDEQGMLFFYGTTVRMYVARLLPAAPPSHPPSYTLQVPRGVVLGRRCHGLGSCRSS